MKKWFSPLLPEQFQIERSGVLLFLLVLLFFSAAGHSQCMNGAIGVSGPGCGCLSGCNLTSFGGPNCSPAVSGNCSAGSVAMSVDIVVPAGCTFTVTATMSNRPGCSASGADAGDQLKVDIPGGPKPFQTGASNATLNDSYSLAGPGTIRVSGVANRADEIITYTTTPSASCPSCNPPLPISLLNFNARPENDYVMLDWVTETEINNAYFTIERAGSDGVFMPIGSMPGAGNSTQPLHYTNFDSDPLEGISYYRLKQTDYNGAFEYFPPVAVFFSQQPDENAANAWNCEGGLCYSVSGWTGPVQIEIFDLAGRKVASLAVSESETGTLPLGSDAAGTYIFHFISEQHREVRKVIR